LALSYSLHSEYQWTRIMSNIRRYVLNQINSSIYILYYSAYKYIYIDLLERYVRDDPTVFSSRIHVQFQAMPGSPLGAARVTWGLAHPPCFQSICVRLDSREGQQLAIQCPEDTSTTMMLMESIPCNVFVTATIVIVGGGVGRSSTSDEVYIGGKSTMLSKADYKKFNYSICRQSRFKPGHSTWKSRCFLG